MNIHEYQSKQVLKSFGVNVPNGIPAFTVDAIRMKAKTTMAGVCQSMACRPDGPFTRSLFAVCPGVSRRESAVRASVPATAHPMRLMR